MRVLMPVLVMKFGGTSVANLDRIARAAKRVGVEVAKGYDVIVIVSAMSGKTNELVGWVNETSPLFDAGSMMLCLHQVKPSLPG